MFGTVFVCRVAERIPDHDPCVLRTGKSGVPKSTGSEEASKAATAENNIPLAASQY
jgi:hypothetical protein